MLFLILKWAFVLQLLSFPHACWSCGSLTHMEIAVRAVEFLNVTYRSLDIRQLALKHPDALRTGSVFPDSFYSGACCFGQYHDISEETHWMPFIKASLDYFNQKYEEKPLDTAGEKLLIFLLGVISHNVADVLWHSLGVDQGFIDTMAELNFYGNYQDAHTVADPGGDSINLYEENFLYYSGNGAEKLKWYVPLDDMLSVYVALGIPFNATVIKTCAADLMKLEAAGELATFEKLYPMFMAKSSFIGSARFVDFFLGGLNEMSAWTVQRWLTAFLYLENKGENCTNTEKSGANPFYWICGLQPPIKALPANLQLTNFHAAFNARSLLGLSTLRPGSESIFTEARHKGDIDGRVVSSLKLNKPQPPCKNWDYFLKKPYSMLGQALLAIDLNGDEIDDLIIGAPGFGVKNRFQEGRVFVLSGAPEKDLNLAVEADFIFKPPSKAPISSQFGYSVAALDFNDDSLLDLVISAPLNSQDAVNALYSGQVFIYYGNKDNGLFSFNTTTPDVIINCEMRYCNYGSSLSTGDVNGDGKADLIIGAPYASRSFESMRQNGLVSVFFSKNKKKKADSLAIKDADLLLWGGKPYSWFGYSVITTSVCDLLIGAPAEHIILSNGTKLQMAGAVYCYDGRTKTLKSFANGSNEFANFGSALSFGYPNGKNSAPIIAISAPNDDNMGKHFQIVPLYLKQSGSVYFFSPLELIGKLAGDRHFGAFGRFIQFVDANSDGYDDLFIGAPIRQENLSYVKSTGQAVGELFLFYGSPVGKFPLNVIQRPCKGDVKPCPEEQADYLFSIGANRAQFGSNAALVKSGHLFQVVVTAQRSDQYGRQAGKLVLFQCKSPSLFKISVSPFSG